MAVKNLVIIGEDIKILFKGVASLLHAYSITLYACGSYSTELPMHNRTVIRMYVLAISVMYF